MSEKISFNLAALPVLCLRYLLMIVAQLPYRWHYALGRGVGRLLYRLAKSRVAIAHKNLSLCYPELSHSELELLLMQNCESAGIGLIETAVCWFMPLKRFSRIYQLEGLEHIERLQAEGTGVILLGFHFTTLEIGGSIVADNSSKLAAMYRSHNDPYFEQMMRTGRLRHAEEVFRREEVRPAIKWLKAGGILWYAADQDYGSAQSIFVPFKGVTAATITATTKFARLSGAKVLPLTQERMPDGRGIKVTVHPPLQSFTGQDAYQDIVAIHQFLENSLNDLCADYMWFHRRFKTRPEGEPELYAKKKRRVKIGADTLKAIRAKANVILLDTDYCQMYRLPEQLYVAIIKRRSVLPLAWFSPAKKLIEDLECKFSHAKVDQVQQCAQEHAYVVFMHLSSTIDEPQLTEYFQAYTKR